MPGNEGDMPLPATRRRGLEVCGLQKSVRLRTQVDRDQDAKMDGLVYIHSTIRWQMKTEKYS